MQFARILAHVERLEFPSDLTLNPAVQPHSTRCRLCCQQFPTAAQLTFLVKTAGFAGG
jgi:hypothetical protein